LFDGNSSKTCKSWKFSKRKSIKLEREISENSWNEISTMVYVLFTWADGVEYIAYVATLTKQKELVEEMQERKQIAMRELDGIAWSDELLARRLGDCEEDESLS
jgi:5'-3' exonuclease